MAQSASEMVMEFQEQLDRDVYVVAGRPVPPPLAGLARVEYE